jgi:ABC-type multidrug transport system fused ATPase/permease subunit
MITPPRAPDSVAAVTRGLWRQISRRRRNQLWLVFALTVLGAMAEVATLGALLPFLAFIVSGARNSAAYPAIEAVVRALGLPFRADSPLALTILFSVAVLVASVVRILLVVVNTRYISAIGYELSVKIFERVLHQSYTHHLSRNTSTVVAALQQVKLITGGVLNPILQSISALIIGVCILVALFFFSPLVSLVVLVGFGGIYAGMLLVFRRQVTSNARILAETQVETIRSVQEGLGGIRDVMIDGRQDAFVRRFSELDRAWWDVQSANALAGTGPRFAVEAAGMVLIAALAYFLVARTGSAASALPLLGVVALGAQRLLPLMQLVYGNWTLVLGNMGSASAMLSVLDVPAADDWRAPRPLPLAFEREIRFKDVSYRYPTGPGLVLRQFDLTIAKGARVGLIGKTGSGKSTLVDLLAGLLEPSSGSIDIDGQPLNAANRRAWQRRIGQVPQAIFLTDASIAENIAFGIDAADIDQHQIELAAERAALAPFIASLPRGYATVVGERGVRLSGGQRQRIGIARALYKDATVLIFDEATSALDVETERAVMDAIGDLPAELTIIIIAHRLTTVDYCEQVIAIDDGRPRIVRSHGGQMPTGPVVA